MDHLAYKFNNRINDDTLRNLAVEASELIRQNDAIEGIFNTNNALHKRSDQQVFLMEQNNKIIFSSTPVHESSPKTKQESSTPVKKKPVTQNLPRRHLQVDDEAKKIPKTGTVEPGNPIRCHTVKESPQKKAKTILVPSADDAARGDYQFASPLGYPRRSTVPQQKLPFSYEIAKMAGRQLIFGDSAKIMSKTGTVEPGTPIPLNTVKESSQKKAKITLVPSANKAATSVRPLMRFVRPLIYPSCSKEPQKVSPYYAAITKMTASLSMTEKEFKSPSKVSGFIDRSKQNFPCSVEVTEMSTKLGMAMKEFRKREKLSSNIYTHNKSKNLVQEEMASTYNTYFLSPEESSKNTDNLGSTNKDDISQVKGMGTISKSIIGSERPSPVKISSTSTIFSDIQELPCLAEKPSMADSLPEDTKVVVSPVQCEKIRISPIQESIETARGSRKRKSPQPTKIQTVFRSIPRVIQHDDKAETDIEVSCDFEYNDGPSTSRSSSADSRSNLIKEKVRSPVGCETKTDYSPKLLEGFSLSSESKISTVASSNVSKTSPGSDKYIPAVKNPSNIPSVVETRDRITESDSSVVENDTVTLTRNIMKFNMLMVARDEAMPKNYNCLVLFQTDLWSVRSYVQKLASTAVQISILANEISKKEMWKTLYDINDIISNHVNNLKSWETEVYLDLNTWRKYLYHISLLKTQYEPLLSKEGAPAVTFEVAQAYEYKLKAIWEKMDGMIMKLDSRRALFSDIACDVLRLMKTFLGFLIRVEILVPC